MKKLLIMMCMLTAGSMAAQVDTTRTPENRKTERDTRVIEEGKVLTDTSADRTIRRSSTTTNPDGTTRRKTETQKTKTKSTTPEDNRRTKQEPNSTTPNNRRTNTSGTGTTVPPRP